MNTKSSKRMLTTTVAIAAALLVSGSATADVTNPPGDNTKYKYFFDATSTSLLPSGVTRPNYLSNSTNIRLGRDYIFAGASSNRTWANQLPTTAYGYISGNDEAGMIVYNKGTPLTSSSCSNSCTLSLSKQEQTCKSVGFAWGLASTVGIPTVGDVSGIYENSKTAQLCLTSTNDYSVQFNNLSSGLYVQLVSGVEYRYARVKVSGKRIVFSQALLDLPATDIKMKDAHKLCLSQGWGIGQSLRNDVSYFRQTVRASGNNWCYVPNMTIQYYVYGPYPEDGVISTYIGTNPVSVNTFITAYYADDDI
jgi:hypothetical protein